ncbi:nucleoside diphosphatase [Diplodia corticola]|uniref:Nucleoside diphosphatase n=1 Tax=Diplodia corticola TaxID=236234 RepID=A0A1J9RJ62_9PEZI|nr:nucleoside diphosphatase [Diplodia corticola]OJD40696.1 nucleoside diphosphatase [Diplodia corticola]
MGKWRYGVILDAGSSGTRVYTYRWLNPSRAQLEASEDELKRLPKLKTKKEWTHKIHPGISTFGETPELVGPDHLQQLLDHALEVVPADEVENTPLFLLATAGMRLLPDNQRAAVLNEVCAYARENTNFQLPDCDLHIQVIPGETEGLYGWIAANYLLGGFDEPKEHDHGKDHHTYGFLDMGGASAQIAFAPNATEAEKHANDLNLLRLRTLDGSSSEYKVFVTTWLGFGVNEARRRYVEALVEASPEATELPDPCIPGGLEVTVKGKPVEPDSSEEKGLTPHLVGTGMFTECLSKTFPLLDKDAPCPDAPCLLHGVHVPAIDFDVNHFVGVSEYWHTTHEIFEMGHKDKAYDFKTYQERVNEFCSKPWEEIEAGISKHQWGNKVDEATALEVCFKASWLINVLHDGIGVPRTGLEEMQSGANGTKTVLDKTKEKGYRDPFQAVNKIDGTEVSWTLGKMVLYAASQVEAKPGALAVGFGSNKPGVPSDFQYAGGKFMSLPGDLDEELEDWHETLFKDSSRRIPGFIMFMFIVLLALYFLCGRECRNRLSRKTRGLFSRGSPKRKPGPGAGLGLGGKLFSRNSGSPTYERVLESGANDFELGDHADGVESYHSDSSSDDSHGKVGHTSGWATPQLTRMAGGSKFDLGPGYFENIVSQGQGLGIASPYGGNAMERGGLMARVDSRERLAPLGSMGRSRSRNGSPTRGRSPLMTPLKESVD